MRKIILSSIAALSIAAGAIGLTMTGASAAPTPAPAQAAGNITTIANPPRFVASPGDTLTANVLKHVKVAGATFGAVTVPENATGVSLNVSNNQSGADGQIRVSAKGTPRSGSATVNWVKGQANTASVFVAIGEDGSISFESTSTTRYLVSLTGYVTPVAAPATPVVKVIAAKNSTKLDQVGGSIRGDKSQALKGATDFGSVTLPAGTWDARVIGGFKGLNNTTKACTTGDNFLTGTMILVEGNGSEDANRLFDFDQVLATDGGVVIPESDSATLTQDPTVKVNPIFTLEEETKITVRLFGYASNSSTECTGTLEGNLQSASFLKIG